MIKKIVSGGQTGADQAALDTAIKWKIPHGGWIPKGRLTEAGTLSNKYQLKELPTDSYPARTEQNVIDSDGTLIISHGPLSEGSKYSQEISLKYGRPCLHIDLNKTNLFKSAKIIYDWIKKFKIETLNVAGARASKDPYIYQATTHLLTSVFHMELIFTTMPNPFKAAPFMPHTVDEVVDILISKMLLIDRTSIAKMEEHELIDIHQSLSGYIRNTFGLWSGNEALLQDCRVKLNKYDIHEDDASLLIIKELWKKLRDTHSLRIIK